MRTLHLALPVTDVQRSLGFYRALGYEVVGSVPDSPEGHLTMLKLPEDDVVAVELVVRTGGGAGGAPCSFVVRVESMQEILRTLTAAGIASEPLKSHDATNEFLTAYVTDPDGHRIELVQWPPGHPAGLTAADWLEDEPGPTASQEGGHGRIARAILDSSAYVVLATADPDGTPWASPVWYATTDHRDFSWASHPDPRHSRNIAARPQVAMVVFDSTVRPSTGQAVSMAATARQVTDTDAIGRGVAAMARAAAHQRIPPLTAADMTGGARLRLYCATVEDHWILDPDSPHDVRVAVRP